MSPVCSAPAAMRSPRSSSTTRVMLGSSSERAWAIECHSRSDSSPSCDLRPCGRWRRPATQKKRVSKRRGRPGGVMARAKNVSRSAPAGSRWRRTPASSAPSAAARCAQRRADEQARLLEGLAHGGQRQRARPGLAGACPSWPPSAFRGRAAPGRCSTAIMPVGGVDAAAGKHVAARHEHHVEAPPPEQHARLARGAVDDDQGRGIARAQRARLGRRFRRLRLLLPSCCAVPR